MGRGREHRMALRGGVSLCFSCSVGWLVWRSQLSERQVPGIQEWVVNQPPLQNAFFASAVQLLSEMPADTKVTED